MDSYGLELARESVNRLLPFFPPTIRSCDIRPISRDDFWQTGETLAVTELQAVVWIAAIVATRFEKLQPIGSLCAIRNGNAR